MDRTGGPAPQPMRSWAAIVKGKDVSDSATPAPPPLPPPPHEGGDLKQIGRFKVHTWGADAGDKAKRAPQGLQPGPRGSRRCQCRGEVLVMLGHYGWIAALEEIDHPDVGKNGGRIYVSWKDTRGTLLAGDIVAFFLYADGQGLGAEGCRVVEPAASSLSVEAPEFVPWEPAANSLSVEAPEFVPGATNKPSSCMRAEADVFVPPSGWGCEPHLSAPDQGMAGPRCPWIMADWLCDSGEEGSASASEEEVEDAASISSGGGGKMRWDTDLDAVVLRAPLKKNSSASQRSASADSSTSAGLSSDFEAQPEFAAGFRLPPGLSLPPGLPVPGAGPRAA